MKLISTVIVFLIVITVTIFVISPNTQSNQPESIIVLQNDTLAIGEISFRINLDNEIYAASDGIKVVIQNNKNSIIHEAISDKNGLFYLKNLDSGIYKIIRFELEKNTYKYLLSYTLTLNLFFEVKKNAVNNLGKLDWSLEGKQHDVKYSKDYYITKIRFQTQYNATNKEWAEAILSENAPAVDKRETNHEGWDISYLDTARGAEYLTSIEKDVILEMNKVRSNPKKYADLYIKPRLKYYNGNTYSPPDAMPIATSEGAKAAQECYDVLSKISSAQILLPSKGLWQAAKDHASDQSKSGKTGHDGSDGSTPFDRIKRYGTYAQAGENIAYKPNTAREIVVGLLIDDGVFPRGHRDNIMHKEYNYAAASVNSHKKYGVICVIEYAKDFISNRR
ncbi:MAG: CAP domain-containing protein [Campylobacteraceae bacterium]|jgi:uncharacterized protein YkwD|nr:CAP domain-containing protein [Campylobacteraceae bacterium]